MERTLLRTVITGEASRGPLVYLGLRFQASGLKRLSICLFSPIDEFKRLFRTRIVTDEGRPNWEAASFVSRPMFDQYHFHYVDRNSFLSNYHGYSSERPVSGQLSPNSYDHTNRFIQSMVNDCRSFYLPHAVEERQNLRSSCS